MFESMTSTRSFLLGYGAGKGAGGGGGTLNLLPYINSYKALFNNDTLPSVVRLDFAGIDFTGKTDFSNVFNYASGVETLTIANLVSDLTTLNFGSAFWACTAKTIIFENCDFAPSNMAYMFRQAANLEEIKGEIDFSNETNSSNLSYIFYADARLKEVRFKPNTLSVSLAFDNNIPLSNDSLVSVANGLVAGAESATLNLGADKKATAQSLMGTNNNGTFVADPGGTLSLADFITNVKGWTL